MFGGATKQRTGQRVRRQGTARPGVMERFNEVREAGEVAFIPFVVAGDPDLETTKEALLRLDRLGADIIEVGVPYSDPLADGPTIQQAATRALAKDAGLEKVLAMLAEVTPQMKAPVVTFTYFNPIMARGPDKFCAMAKAAGASGLLVPDIPLEETEEMRKHCEEAGLELVLLTTPTTPEERMGRIAEASQGFIYLVSVTGVTGARSEVSNRVEGLVKSLKAQTDKPVAVGFGVSKPEQVKQLVSWGADGVIVGSAFVRALGESSSPAEGLDKMEALGKELKAATKR